MVQQIKRLKPELQLQTLHQSHSLLRREVHADEIGSAENASAPCAEYLRSRGRCESTQVPEIQNLFRPIIRIGDDIAVVLFEIGIVHCRIAGMQAGLGKSSACHGDSADLPTTQ